MATSIHSSLSCLLPFYTIPIFPLFKSFIYLYNYRLYMYTYARGAAKRPCPLDAGSAGTPSKQFCQTCEAFVNLTVNTRRYCVHMMFMIVVYLDMKIFLD